MLRRSFGEGGAGEGAAPLPSPSALETPSVRGTPDAGRDSGSQLLRLRSPAPARGSSPAPSADFAVPVAAAGSGNAPPSLHSPLVPPPARTLRPVAAPWAVARGSRLPPPPAARNAGWARRDSAPPDTHWPARKLRSRPAAVSSPAGPDACRAPVPRVLWLAANLPR